MTKKHAPDIPDAKWHRPGDLAYLRELLTAAGLSQRGAGRVLGINERTMRNKASGEAPLSYPEQYALEVLADLAQATGGEQIMNAVADTPRYNTAGTEWHTVSDRPVTAADAGKLLVGRDRFGAPVYGSVIRDNFGVVVKAADGLDVHNVPIERVHQYALLDQPPPHTAT